MFNYFTPERKFYKIDDISYGKENVPVSCVNSLDNNYPEYVEYSTVRLPQKKVDIPLDEGFLTCCDCDDGCQVNLQGGSKKMAPLVIKQRNMRVSSIFQHFLRQSTK